MLQRTEGGDFYLIDLGSRNGTFVNGRRVSIPVTLTHGDRLTLGQTEFDFFCPVQPPRTNRKRLNAMIRQQHYCPYAV